MHYWIEGLLSFVHSFSAPTSRNHVTSPLSAQRVQTSNRRELSLLHVLFHSDHKHAESVENSAVINGCRVGHSFTNLPVDLSVAYTLLLRSTRRCYNYVKRSSVALYDFDSGKLDSQNCGMFRRPLQSDHETKLFLYLRIKLYAWDNKKQILWIR